MAIVHILTVLAVINASVLISTHQNFFVNFKLSQVTPTLVPTLVVLSVYIREMSDTSLSFYIPLNTSRTE